MNENSQLQSQIERMIKKANETLEAKEFARYIKSLRSDRETGDYSYMLVVDENKAKQDIDMAREFIEKVEEYLKVFLNRKTQEE